jgi:hypothetical protein
MATDADGDSDAMKMVDDIPEILTESPPSAIMVVTMADQSAMEDLDSQPLNDLGVSVMDQDVLERNVAAQVRILGNITDVRRMQLCRNGKTS